MLGGIKNDIEVCIELNAHRLKQLGKMHGFLVVAPWVRCQELVAGVKGLRD